MSNIDKLKLIWDGEIPICFTLAGDEISTVKQPDPIFVSFTNFEISCYFTKLFNLFYCIY